MRLRRLFAGLVLGLAVIAGRAGAQSLGPDHVKAQLAAESAGAAPGSTVYVAVVQKIDPGWHTYWRNPGDAGEATKIAWTVPASWRAGDIVWPAPERLPVGPLMNYGYEGEVLLPVPIEIPASAKPGQSAHIAAAVSFLVCADVCVPQDSTLTLDLPILAGAAPLDPAWGTRIAKTLADAPKPNDLSAAYQASGGTVKIAVSGPALTGRVTADAYFYPFECGVIDHAKPQAIELGERGLTFAVATGARFQSGPTPAEIDGVVETGDGAAFEVAARPGP